MHLEGVQMSRGSKVLCFGNFGFFRLCRLAKPVRPVLETGQTGLALLSAASTCPGGVACVHVLCFELCFVSAVSSRCPCLRGPRLAPSSDSCLRFALGVLITCWRLLFFLLSISILNLLMICGVCCQCTHQGGD